MKPLGRAATAAWIALVLVMPLVTLWLVARDAVNVPISDDWSLIPLFEQRDAGTLGLGDLVAQHFEHIPVVPRAADLFMAPLTHWDLRVELYRNFGVALVTLAVVLVALRRSLERDRFLALAVVASLLLFTPVQWENWLWGWQLEWFLSNLAAIAAFAALASTTEAAPRRGLAIAVAGGLVATFSLGQGLLVWPVGLAILLLRRRPWMLWAGAGAVTYALYFARWSSPPETGSKTRFTDLPVETADFVLQYLGRALATGHATARLAGAALLAGFVTAVAAVVRRRDDETLRRAATWIAVGLYALGAAAVTASARVMEDVDVLSRYSVMGGLFALATVALVGVAAPRGGRAIVAGVAVPVLLAGAIAARQGADDLRDQTAGHEVFAQCLRTNTAPEQPCGTTLPPLSQELLHREIVLHWRYVAYLKRKGWAGF